MAAWLPVLKASLPYLTKIVAAAIPAFTARSAAEKADEVVPRQIAELQAAVTGNAESIKALAAQLKQTIEGIDPGVGKLQQEMARLRRVAFVAVVVAAAALGTALWAVLV